MLKGGARVGGGLLGRYTTCGTPHYRKVCVPAHRDARAARRRKTNARFHSFFHFAAAHA